MAETPNVLILTATITPPLDARSLARTDPVLRFNDYRQALKFYLSYLRQGKISGLVFAENSGSDVTELQNLCSEYGVAQKTEFIAFAGLDYPPVYGRGHGEFKMIDHVMENSQIIRKLPTQANIWKITGRYIIHNLEDVIRTRPTDSDLYCHCRNLRLHKPWVDLYVLCWNKEAYHKMLKNIYNFFRDDQNEGCSEHIFRKMLDEKDFGIKVVKRFRTVLEVEGVRGENNQKYQDEKTKLFLRKLANLIIPWLWI